MVAGCVYHGDTVLLEAPHLLQQEPLGLEGESVTVEEVSSDEQRVGVLSDGEVGGPAEGLAGRLPESTPYGR